MCRFFFSLIGFFFASEVLASQCTFEAASSKARGYFFDGTNINLKEFGFDDLIMLKGEASVVGQLRAVFMGKHYAVHSRYWGGPALLNTPIPPMRNSTVIAGEAHNRICDDVRSDPSIELHFFGYSRGAAIALEVAHRLHNSGCFWMKKRSIPVRSFVMVDPVRQHMGILDPLSLTWPHWLPPNVQAHDVLVLEKSIKPSDVSDHLERFIQFNILETMRFKENIHHAYIYGDGTRHGGVLHERIDHHKIAFNMRTAYAATHFSEQRGGCFGMILELKKK